MVADDSPRRRPQWGGLLGRQYSAAARRPLLVVIGALLAVALAVGVVGYEVSVAHQRSLDVHGVVTSGTVTASEAAPRGAGDVVVAFTGADGQRHSAQLSATSQLAVGSAVTVRYDRTDPANATLLGAAASGPQSGLFLATDIALALALAVLGVVALRPRLRRRG